MMSLCRAHQYSRSSFQQYEAACRSPGSDNISNQRNKTQLIRLKCKYCLHKPEDSKSINENFPLFKITFSPRTLLALSAITAPDKPAPTVEIIAKI